MILIEIPTKEIKKFSKKYSHMQIRVNGNIEGMISYLYINKDKGYTSASQLLEIKNGGKI